MSQAPVLLEAPAAGDESGQPVRADVKPASGRIRVLKPPPAQWRPAGTPIRAELLAIETDGVLLVRATDGSSISCDCLEGVASSGSGLKPGDVLLVLVPHAGAPVVVGRVGRYRAPAPEKHVRVEAQESLSLKCGEASIDLRADGKLMVKGEDVLVKARGTQRIKAGTVNIN